MEKGENEWAVQGGELQALGGISEDMVKKDESHRADRERDTNAHTDLTQAAQSEHSNPCRLISRQHCDSPCMIIQLSRTLKLNMKFEGRDGLGWKHFLLRLLN